MSGILVVIEERDGRVSRISWEALAAGQLLGSQTVQPVSAVVIGANTDATSAEAAAKAVNNVIRVSHSLLERYTPDAYIAALHQLIQKEDPAYVVFPHTYQVRDFAPALAARLVQVLISDVVAIADGPVFTRQLKN